MITIFFLALVFNAGALVLACFLIESRVPEDVKSLISWKRIVIYGALATAAMNSLVFEVYRILTAA